MERQAEEGRMNRTTAMKMVVDDNQRFATSTRSIVLSAYTLTNHDPVTSHSILVDQTTTVITSESFVSILGSRA